MKISVVGTGYVGLVAGVCFADAGHHVICVDRDKDKIDRLKEGIIPIYEPGLEELLHQSKPRMEFTTDLDYAVQNTEVVFIAVGTPEKEDGSADMGPTYAVTEGICRAANCDKFIVLKSTVPIGTSTELQAFCNDQGKYKIEIINNPEFLKEGAAIEDFLKPDRVVIGCKTEKAEGLMREIYAPFLRNGNPIYFMDNVSAEMTKYAANAFLSVKISFANELALLADKVGADINSVRQGFTSDSRICPAFFYPGVGYGGSCFPKDVQALAHTGNQHGVEMQIVCAADAVNDRQKLVLVDKARDHFGSLKGLKIGLWGLSFKPRTDDVREAPALYIVEKLVSEGAEVVGYDPIAAKTFQAACSSTIAIKDSAEEVLEGVNALFIVTEWNEFRNPDLSLMKEKMKTPVVFDGRNVLDPGKMAALGFQYFCIGRQIKAKAAQ